MVMKRRVIVKTLTVVLAVAFCFLPPVAGAVEWAQSDCCCVTEKGSCLGHSAEKEGSRSCACPPICVTAGAWMSVLPGAADFWLAPLVGGGSGWREAVASMRRDKPLIPPPKWV